jgi:hypothetical protein
MATVFEVLDQKCAEQQSNQETFLITGGAKDIAEYREACGVIRGLAIARREIADLAKHIVESEEE